MSDESFAISGEDFKTFERLQLERAIDDVLAKVRAELLRAKTKHPKPFNSAHEGYGVIVEEVAELFDEVRADDRHSQIEEAIQVAAMGARFVLELKERE